MARIMPMIATTTISSIKVNPPAYPVFLGTRLLLLFARGQFIMPCATISVSAGTTIRCHANHVVYNRRRCPRSEESNKCAKDLRHRLLTFQAVQGHGRTRKRSPIVSRIVKQSRHDVVTGPDIGLIPRQSTLHILTTSVTVPMRPDLRVVTSVPCKNHNSLCRILSFPDTLLFRPRSKRYRSRSSM